MNFPRHRDWPFTIVLAALLALAAVLAFLDPSCQRTAPPRWGTSTPR